MTVKCPRCYERVETSQTDIAKGLAIAQGIAMAGSENLTAKELMELEEVVADD